MLAAPFVAMCGVVLLGHFAECLARDDGLSGLAPGPQFSLRIAPFAPDLPALVGHVAGVLETDGMGSPESSRAATLRAVAKLPIAGTIGTNDQIKLATIMVFAGLSAADVERSQSADFARHRRYPLRPT